MPAFSEDDRKWLVRLGQVITDLARRHSAQVSGAEISKASKFSRGRDIAVWVHPVRVYHVTDSDRRHLVAVTEGRDENEIIGAECGTCGMTKVCSHVLAVLAGHPGRLVTDAPDEPDVTGG